MSTNAILELDLAESAQKISFPGDSFVDGIGEIHKSVPFVLGKIKDFKPKINELKLFKGDEEHRDEAAMFNEKLMRWRDQGKKLESDPIIGIAYKALLGNSLPLTPYPSAERCLGLGPQGSIMKIHEGYAVLAFDFEVNPAQSYCLFQMQDMLVDREMRMLEKAAGAAPGVKETMTNEVTANMLRQGMEGIMNVA